jgi:acetolactate synthase-1/2/3 large subunit
MAREQLGITVVIFNNRSYGILNVELARVGARDAGPKAGAQLDLSSPDIDLSRLPAAFGVPARRVDDAEALLQAIERGLAEPGPSLIEVLVPPVFSPRQLRAMPYALRAISSLPRPLAGAVKRRVYP